MPAGASIAWRSLRRALLARDRVVALLALALLTLAAPRAHAWTNAAVQSVQARVVVASDASAIVTLTADVRVHGGWLEGLELAGLDPDLVLDEASPPFAIDEAGGRYSPRAEVLSGGRVQLSFARRSPRRGRLQVGIVYRTSLAHRATEPVDGEARVRVRWTLPGWRSGLDGVAIELVAPRGTRIAPYDESDTGASMHTDVAEVAEGTRISWRRAHLPRTLSWTVAVDVPAEAMIPELRGAPVAAQRLARQGVVSASADPRPFWALFALAIVLLACAKVAITERMARRSRAQARPLVPAPWYARVPLALALGAASAWVGADSPSLALALLAIVSLGATYRRADALHGTQLGAWRPVDVRWIRAARRARWMRLVAPSSLVDATTPLGLAHLVAWLSLPAWSGAPLSLTFQICAAVLPLPMLVTGTRVAFPTGPADALAMLLGATRRLATLPDEVGLRPVVHVDVRGEVQDARVRTVLARRPSGLLRLDFAMTDRAKSAGYERAPAILVLTREGSAAERALGERLPDVRGVTSPGGRRVVRVVGIEGNAAEIIARVVSALADCPEAPAASRGTAAIEETVRELPAPKAVGF